jgi:DNA-binding Xre family transcriptional regulator
MTSHSSTFDVGRSIRIAQAAQNVSNTELAERMGVGRSRVQDYRTAKDMKLSTVFKVCNALDVDIKDFLSY